MSEEPQITFSQGSDVGRVRDHNEDWVAVEDPTDPERKQKGRLFIVADGMGGYQAGEVASQMAAETVVRAYYADPSQDPTVRLRNAVQAGNEEVYRQAQSNPARTGMGTTMVAAAQIGQTAYIASVGDSRAYVVHQGVLSQITQDHSFVGEQVRAGLLTKEQARVHPQRNVITRALGSQPTVQVDTFVGELSDGDILVMCTDGLTGHLSEEGIRDTVVSMPPGQAVPRLIELAKEDGGTDNISVIVVRVDLHKPIPETAAPQPESEPATLLTTQSPTTQPTPESPPQRKGSLSLIWVAVGVLIVLMGVIAVGVVALGLSGLLSFDGLRSPTPTVAPTSLPVTPSVAPVETTATVTATPLPTQTTAPTLAATHTRAPTRTPLIQISPLEPRVTPPPGLLQSPVETPAE
jgi:serine/threonine protein phosphatase PrpC